jgi:hypothetical protein
MKFAEPINFTGNWGYGAPLALWVLKKLRSGSSYQVE